jgi:hypothetical protein
MTSIKSQYLGKEYEKLLTTDVISMVLIMMKTVLFTCELAHPMKSAYSLRSVPSNPHNYQNPL